MPIRFQCKCGKAFKVTDELAGKRSKCPQCGISLIIPTASTIPPRTGGKGAAPNAPAAPSAPIAPAAPPTSEAPELKLDVEPPLPAAPKLAMAPEPPAAPPKPPAGEMELVEEHFGAGGKADVPPAAPPAAPPPPSAPAAPELQLVTEHFGAAGKAVTEEEHARKAAEQASAAAPVPHIQPREADLSVAPPDDGGEIAVGVEAEDRRCGKCGMPLARDAVICVECGAKVGGKDTAAPPPPPPPRKGIGPIFERIRSHKQFKVIAAGATGAVLGIGAAIFFMLRKPEAPPPEPPKAAAAPAPAPAAPAPPKPEEKPKPPPEPVVQWAGLTDPATAARHRLMRIGGQLLAWMEKNKRAPASLAEAGIAPADAEACQYVGPEVAALARYRPLLHGPAPDAPGVSLVYFSDGSVWRLSSDEWNAALPVKTPAGWLTPADSALLARSAPQVRVVNLRAAPVTLALDGKEMGALSKGETRTLSSTAGAHELRLTVGAASETFTVTLKPGIIYIWWLPRRQDMPYIPVRAYRDVLNQRATGYTIERDGNAVKALRGPNETVLFSTDGRTAIPSDSRSIAARVEREAVTIEGIENKPIQLDDISRLEEGALRYRNGGVAVCRRTALGVVRSEEAPNADLAAPALYPAAPKRVMMPGMGPGAGPGMPPMAPGMPPDMMRPDMPPEMMRPGMPGMPPGFGGPATPVAVKLTFPTPVFRVAPDCQALAATLRTMNAPATALMLQQGQAIAKRPPEVRGPEGGIPGMPPGMPPDMRPPVPGPGGPGMPGPGGPGMPGPGGAVREAPRLAVDRLLAPPDLPPATLYAALAVCGDPAAIPFLTAQFNQMAEGAGVGFGELLLALARCGGGSMVAQVRGAASKSSAMAAIALSAIDDPAARKALAEVVAGWTPADAAETVRLWPDVAGPSCRRALVETIAVVQPALLENVPTLNTLLPFDVGTLERVLVARVVPPPAPPAGQPVPTTTVPAPPKEHDEPPMPTPAPQAAATPGLPAPASWLVLGHLRNPEAVAWFMKLVAGKDAARKQQALAALAEVKDPSLTAPVALALKEKDAPVRRAAARVLLAIGDGPAVKALTDHMDKDLALTAIIEAVPGLVRKAGREATADLLAKMLDAAARDAKASEAPKPGPGGPPPDMPPPDAGMPPGAPGAAPVVSEIAGPVAIAEAIGKLGAQTAAVKAALEAARKHPDPAVRAAVCCARATVGAGPVAGNPLRGLLKLPRALAPSAHATGPAPAVSKDLLAEGLKDPSPVVRVAALGLLKGSSVAAAVPMIETAMKDSAPEVRIAALKVLPELTGADPRRSAILAAAIADANPAIVTAAARAAARCGDASVGPAVLAALNQPAARAEEAGALPALVEAIAALKVPGAANSVMLLLANPNAEVKTAAIRALAALGDPAAVPSLVNALQSKDTDLAPALVPALAQFNSPAAVQAVLALLPKDDLPVEQRQSILAQAVARCLQPGPYADWAARGAPLKEADFDVLLSLAATARPAQRAAFLQLGRRFLGDARPEVRARAAALLARYGDDPAVRDQLLAALRQDASGVAPAVAEVLREMRDPSMVEKPLFELYRQLAEVAGVGGSAAAGTTAGTPGPSARLAGLAKASPEENLQLRLAIIPAIGAIGGDEAARALRKIVAADKSPEIGPALVAALEKTRSALTVQFLSEYVLRPDAPAGEVIGALARLGPLNREKAVETLQALMRNIQTPPDSAAAAADALDELNIKPGA